MKDLSIKSKSYILGTIAVGIGLYVWQLSHLESESIWAWLGLGAIAAVAHILKVEGATAKSSYQISLMVYGFTLVAYGTPALVFVILVAHMVEWGWHKYPWYIQSFNIATFAIAATGAGLIYAALDARSSSLSLIGALGIVLAMTVFTFLNHLMIGIVVKLARGESFVQSGVFGLMTLMMDFSLLCLGGAAALIWSLNPFAVVLTIVPLYLIYSTLKVPALQRQTEIDPKTGLFNARYFARALESELVRADRFDRPLTLVMADLDLLRNINNTYGHLAGDQVLIGIAEILRKSFRDYDVVARFGGEEFAILMPETTPQQAFPRVEAIREAIEAAGFDVPTSVTPIKATMSFGLAGRDRFSLSASDLVHNSDLALYRAKLEGRNQTTIYSGDGLESLFQGPMPDAPVKDEGSFEARLDLGQQPFEPPPLRHAARLDQQPAVPSALKPRPAWTIKVYLAAIGVLSAILLILSLPGRIQQDWVGLGIFSLVVLLTEGLSIEIYAKDTSVSTAATPMVAGVLLFGPLAVLTLSLIQALTAVLKHRSRISRLLFNTTNQITAGILSIVPLIVFRMTIDQMPIPLVLALVLLASAINYLVSTALLAGVIGLDTGYSIRYVWKERFRWLAPYYLALGVVAFALLHSYLNSGIAGVIIILVPLLMLRLSQVQYIDHTKSMVTQLRNKNEALEKSAKEIARLNEELLLALSHAIDLRDPYVLGHSQRVAQYATMIAEELELPPERVELVRRAGLLHDIGKLGVRESILFKPGRLTEEEYTIVKEHSALGAEILDNCPSFRVLVPIIRYHHERYDGLGYPDGLRAHDIPIEARILSLADAIEAMASARPYRKALDFDAILVEIQENAGGQFDPMVTQAFLNLIQKEGAAIFGKTVRHGKSETPVRVQASPKAEKHPTIPILEPT